MLHRSVAAATLYGWLLYGLIAGALSLPFLLSRAWGGLDDAVYDPHYEIMWGRAYVSYLVQVAGSTVLLLRGRAILSTLLPAGVAESTASARRWLEASLVTVGVILIVPGLGALASVFAYPDPMDGIYGNLYIVGMSSDAAHVTYAIARSACGLVALMTPLFAARWPPAPPVSSEAAP